jgi:phosphoribosyl 1,2-cyclic phosphodiesterase|nr:MAG TPA: beta-lactamase [Caudoviricetes sp.]
MTYNIISTGSKGNAVVINDRILIDCGIPFKALEPVKKDLRLVLLTHIHSDHFNPRTARALSKERPALRWGCCEWMVGPLLEAGVDKRRIDVLDPAIPAFEMYGNLCSIRPVMLTHNVPNCGYHILSNGERLFYATDTGTLDGIEARCYDLYMVEANHTRADLEARMEAKRAAGEFSYEWAAAQNHLSKEQAEEWLYQQMGPNSRYVFLHQHQRDDFK